MSTNMFGITRDMPAQETADRWDEICREEGGYGYIEVNRTRNEAPGINNGEYQGWFTAPDLGAPFDQALRCSVMRRITT